MKKILLLIAGVFSVVNVFAADEVTATEQEQDFQCVIDVTKVTTRSAHFSVSATDGTVFYWEVVKAAVYDDIVAGKNTAYSDINDLANKSIKVWGGQGFPMSQILTKGSDSATVTLDSNTEYVAYAVAVDPETGEVKGTVVAKRITSLENLFYSDRDEESRTPKFLRGSRSQRNYTAYYGLDK